MDTSNLHTFTLQIPIGIHLVTPLATSGSLLDQFSLLLATSLGSLQQASQRNEIERALSTEPLKDVQPYELSLALRDLAYETAQQITTDFVSKLKSKLIPKLPPLITEAQTPVAEETKEPVPVPPVAEEKPNLAERNPEPQPEPEPILVVEPQPKPEPEPEPVTPKTQPPSSYSTGQKVENPVLAEVVGDIGKCGNGFNFVKVPGGWNCEIQPGQLGRHFVSDAEVESEYQRRIGK